MLVKTKPQPVFAIAEPKTIRQPLYSVMGQFSAVRVWLDKLLGHLLGQWPSVIDVLRQFLLLEMRARYLCSLATDSCA